MDSAAQGRDERCYRTGKADGIRVGRFQVERELDRAITDIGVAILALRACDKAGEPVPSRLRAHIRVMEDEWFNQPTPEGARRREKLSDA